MGYTIMEYQFMHQLLIKTVYALMTGWGGIINDVKGAFLKGNLDKEKEQMYIKVPKRI